MSIWRVDLNRQKVSREEIPLAYSEKLLGGRALGSLLLYKELKAGIEPLSEENKLIFLTGPLTGTAAPGSSRYVVLTKSPQTGIYLMALAGGYFGPALKKLGCDGLIIEGRSQKPVVIVVSEDQVYFKDGSNYWGLQTTKAQELIKQDIPDVASIACIGPAGEKGVPYAAILNERRAVGRGGSGAVMGVQNLKAVVLLNGNQKVNIADPKGFTEAVRQGINDLTLNNSTNEVLPKYGSCGTGAKWAEVGLVPQRNWQENVYGEQSKNFFGEVIRKFVVKDTSCAPPCPVRCSKHVKVSEGPFANSYSDGPEYESIYALGSACGITDFGAVIAADEICDEIGVDTISAGISIAFAMECYEKGIITSADTGGKEVRFGDAGVLIELLKDIATQKDFGKVLSLGVREMAKIFGQGSEDFAMHAKGLELGGYDPRAARGYALTYACGARGGCHHAGGHTAFAECFSGQYDRFSNRGKASLVKQAREKRVLSDSLILCTFNTLGLSDDSIAKMMSCVTGNNYTISNLIACAERGSLIERAYNVREGLRREWDVLPGRILNEQIKNGPNAGQNVQNFNELIDEFYKECGWDLITGAPTEDSLKKYGLAGIL